MWPRKLPRGRAKWSVKFFDDLGLPLVHEHVGAPQRTNVERLVTRVQDENLLHPDQKSTRLTSWPVWNRILSSGRRRRTHGQKRVGHAGKAGMASNGIASDA